MRRVLKILVGLGFVIGLVLLVRAAGPFLIIDRPSRSDILVMLAGDHNDVRLRRSEQLLRDGYAPRGFLDALNSITDYGRTPADDAQEYLARAPEPLHSRMTVCTVAADSTVEEMRGLRVCMEKAKAHSALIVTSDYHTRRALSIARKLLPQYEWSVAAAPTAASAPKWWRSRAATRDIFLEWEKLLWWKIVESHQ